MRQLIWLHMALAVATTLNALGIPQAKSSTAYGSSKLDFVRLNSVCARGSLGFFAQLFGEDSRQQ